MMQRTEERKIIRLDGITCPACVHKIETTVRKQKGVISAGVDYASSTADILYQPQDITLDDIQNAIEQIGYTILPDAEPPAEEETSSRSFFVFVGLIIVGLYIIIKNTIGFDFFPAVSQSMGYGMLFVVGLFTSVHCLAMCGGINLSQCAGGCESSGIYHKLLPSFLYNFGRVTSYTVLGGIVGALGSVISVSVKGKAVISLIAGLFMVIMGINMLGVLPVLRKLMPRLPKGLTKKLNSGKSSKTPFVVGLLNGFMPCGPLQAMQLYALGTGSFLTGALSMLLFSLGTVPLMLAFGALSTLLSSRFTKQMMKISAMLVIILGVVMGSRGFSLAGISVTDTLLAPLGIVQTQKNKTPKAVLKDGYQTVTTTLASGKYQPITVYAGVPLKWTIVAGEGSLNGCNNEIIIPDYRLQQKLQLGENVIEFTPEKTGTITYTCWMGMISSKITVV